MTDQLNILLLLSGVFQGLILSFWFFKNHSKKLAHTYFTLFLIVVSLQLMFKVVSKAWLMDNMKMIYFFSYAFPFLAGPLIFLYVKTQKTSVFRWSHLLHVIPFIVSVATVVLMLTRGMGSFFMNAYVLGITQTISLGVYSYLSFRMAPASLKSLIIYVALAEWLIIVAIGWMTFLPHPPYVKQLFIAATLLIYWISYRCISPSNLFVQEEPVKTLSFSKRNKYARSGLKTEKSRKMKVLLEKLIMDEKLFLDPSLTIDELSNRLNTSRHHISQVINEQMHKTYSEYINDLRLDEAYRRLINPLNAHYTLSAIAFDSGFSSVSIFNTLFKRKFGTTPSKFRGQFVRKIRTEIQA